MAGHTKGYWKDLAKGRKRHIDSLKKELKEKQVMLNEIAKASHFEPIRIPKPLIKPEVEYVVLDGRVVKDTLEGRLDALERKVGKSWVTTGVDYTKETV